MNHKKNQTKLQNLASKRAPSAALHVALLRGINVGGKNKMSMRELAAIFEESGCGEVRTYIQSGNVVFMASPSVARKVPATVTQVIHDHIKQHIPVILRTESELRSVVRSNPFLKVGADPRSLHVAFLQSVPRASRARGMDPERSPGDSFQLRGRELYLRLPNGTARTKITNAWIDSQLETTSTIRNWRTVLKLLEIAGGSL